MYQAILSIRTNTSLRGGRDGRTNKPHQQQQNKQSELVEQNQEWLVLPYGLALYLILAIGKNQNNHSKTIQLLSEVLHGLIILRKFFLHNELTQLQEVNWIRCLYFGLQVAFLWCRLLKWPARCKLPKDSCRPGEIWFRTSGQGNEK